MEKIDLTFEEQLSEFLANSHIVDIEPVIEDCIMQCIDDLDDYLSIDGEPSIKTNMMMVRFKKMLDLLKEVKEIR